MTEFINQGMNIIIDGDADDATSMLRKLTGEVDKALGNKRGGLAAQADRAQKKTRSLGDALGGLGAKAKLLKGPLVALGAGLAALGAGTLAAVRSTAKVGDEFQKMSLRTGVAAENLSTLKFAAERSGAEFNLLEKGLQRMTRNALEASEGTGEAAKAFEQMGVAVTDTNGQLRPAFDMMLDLSDSLGALTSDSEAAAQAQRLFGRAGAELLPLLKEGRSGIRALQKEARSLGLEFSTKSAEDAASFEDAMTNLSGAWSAGSQALGKELLPVITEWINRMASGMVWMTGFSKVFRASLGQWVTSAAAAFDETLVAWDNWNKTTELLAKTTAGVLFEPLALAGRIVWARIEYAARISWNAIGEDVTWLVNEMINEFNRFGGRVGLVVDNIDFSPLTIEAPKTLREEWDASWLFIDNSLTEISRLNKKASEDWERDWAKVGEGWNLTLSQMIADAAIAGDKAMETYLRNVKLTLAADGDADLVIPSRDKGTKAGEAMIEGMGGVFAEGFETLLLDQDTIGALTGVGEDVTDLLLTGVTDRMGQEAANNLKPFETYGEDAGDAIIDKISDRMSTFFSPTARLFDRAFEKSGMSNLLDRILPDDFGENIGTNLGTGIGAGLTTYFGLRTLDQLTGGNIPNELIVGISIADAVMSATGTSMGDLATAAQNIGGAFSRNLLGPVKTGLSEFFQGKELYGGDRLTSGLSKMLPDAMLEGKGAAIGSAFSMAMAGAIIGSTSIGETIGGVFGVNGSVAGAISASLGPGGAIYEAAQVFPEVWTAVAVLAAGAVVVEFEKNTDLLRSTLGLLTPDFSNFSRSIAASAKTAEVLTKFTFGTFGFTTGDDKTAKQAAKFRRLSSDLSGIVEKEGITQEQIVAAAQKTGLVGLLTATPGSEFGIGQGLSQGEHEEANRMALQAESLFGRSLADIFATAITPLDLQTDEMQDAIDKAQSQLFELIDAQGTFEEIVRALGLNLSEAEGQVRFSAKPAGSGSDTGSGVSFESGASTAVDTVPTTFSLDRGDGILTGFDTAGTTSVVGGGTKAVVGGGGFLADDLFAFSDMVGSGRISKSRLIGMGPGKVSSYLANSDLPGVVKAGIMALANDSIPTVVALASEGLAGHGFDVVARRGANFIANKPTSALFGEAGPEHVQITPMSQMRGVTSAGRNSATGQTVINVNVNNPQFLDVRGAGQWINDQLGPAILRYLRTVSGEGHQFIYNKSLLS